MSSICLCCRLFLLKEGRESTKTVACRLKVLAMMGRRMPAGLLTSILKHLNELVVRGSNGSTVAGRRRSWAQRRQKRRKRERIAASLDSRSVISSTFQYRVRRHEFSYAKCQRWKEGKDKMHFLSDYPLVYPPPWSVYTCHSFCLLKSEEMKRRDFGTTNLLTCPLYSLFLAQKKKRKEKTESRDFWNRTFSQAINDSIFFQVLLRRGIISEKKNTTGIQRTARPHFKVKTTKICFLPEILASLFQHSWSKRRLLFELEKKQFENTIARLRVTDWILSLVCCSAHIFSSLITIFCFLHFLFLHCCTCYTHPPCILPPPCSLLF